jgi:hypothetical protein
MPRPKRTRASFTPESIERIRRRINVNDIVNAFADHIKDPIKNPIKQTQIKAGQVLLGKVMPDLTHSEITEHKLDESYDGMIEKLKSLLGSKADLVLEALGVKPEKLVETIVDVVEPVIEYTHEDTRH